MECEKIELIYIPSSYNDEYFNFKKFLIIFKAVDMYLSELISVIYILLNALSSEKATLCENN